MEKNERKLKTARLVAVVLFIAMIASTFVLLLVLPKKAGELSSLEFRTLADYPFRGLSFEKLTAELVRGDSSKKVDKFLEDHFPGRSFFIALNSYYLRLTGRNADQSVVWGRNSRLFDAAAEPDFEQTDKNVGAIDAFAEANGLQTVFVNVPTSAVVVTEDLPAVHLEYHDAEIIDRVREKSSADVPDLIEMYSSREDRGKLFYRTDHHWTMDGAYLCYEMLCEKLGTEPVSKDEFTVSSFDFYGSFYRKAGLWLTEPDELQIWRSPKLDAMKVTIGSGDSAVVHEGVYDEEKLVPGEVDRYAAYLYSNNAVTVIENPDGNGRTLMIVKDSFGNSIAPLLAMNYSTVVMIDTRYYSPAVVKPSELCSLYGVEQLVVVMGTDSTDGLIEATYLR